MKELVISTSESTGNWMILSDTLIEGKLLTCNKEGTIKLISPKELEESTVVTNKWTVEGFIN